MTDPKQAKFVEVAPSVYGVLFSNWRESGRNADATSAFSDEPGTRYMINGWAGYAVRADGELVLVHSLRPGLGDAIMTSAIEHGATYLDCFDGYLPTFYARHGFETVATVPNWTLGGPDVVLMSLPGYADRHGVTA